MEEELDEAEQDQTSQNYASAVLDPDLDEEDGHGKRGMMGKGAIGKWGIGRLEKGERGVRKEMWSEWKAEQKNKKRFQGPKEKV